MSKTKITLPLAGRTFERTQGCWNCVHYADKEESLRHWQTVAKPMEDARIAVAKQRVIEEAPVMDPNAVARVSTNRNASCPCNSGQKYKRCHYDKDRDAVRVAQQLKAIEQGVILVERFELAITGRDAILGSQGLCKNRFAPQGGGYKADNFLCDRWTAVTGASVARAGQKADPLPEELKDIHGDGN